MNNRNHSSGEMAPLTVYRASAGSGKTFRLTVHYIKLLVADPSAYRRILAVTFTNKATEEMKMRILTQLYGISHRCNDSDTQSYLQRIVEETGLGEETVRERAGIALGYLLHNYSYFRVETIDSFFQSVLRNLAHELDLTANLRVELNDREVEQLAVDELIDSLNSQSRELTWILEYIRENMEDDKSWNVIGAIKRFGENIFKDIYKQEHGQLNQVLHQSDFFARYSGQLKKIKRESRESMLRLADEFFEKLEQCGLSVSDFASGERGVCGYFVKLRKEIFDDKLLTKTVVEAFDNPSKWLKKADQVIGNPLGNAVDDIFQPLLLKAERNRIRLFKLYKSADLTLRHLNQLRLLNSIDERVHEMNKTANRFLLSDTQALLNALIQDSDSPFIFEKIGTQIDHIMIDEFQDTSTIQWQNFKVLLKECMSRRNSQNLIVGDVKQSIYRWRSGDWRLLNDIESQFSEEQLKADSLKENRRSALRVIQFNNAFFNVAKSVEEAAIAEENEAGARQLAKAYSDVEQLTNACQNHGGFVHVELFAGDDYTEKTLEKTRKAIENLLQNGSQPKGIAILVRSNKTIQAIADYLSKEMPEVPLVSDEAFRLDASMAVNVLIEALRALSQPENQVARAYLAKVYQLNVLAKPIGEDEIFRDIEQIDQFLPQPYVHESETLRSMPVYDLCQQLYRIFKLDAIGGQTAYLCAFYDILNKFVADNLASVETFLEAWDEDLHEKTIQGTDIDGIRLLTIHKSKGLEYETVLMPFCDWRLELSNLIWCKLSDDDTPFNELPIVPIDYSASQMRGTIFDAHYQDEHLQNTVDNLNLLYVAFTRARQNLFVWGKKDTKGLRSHVIGQALQEVAEMLNDSELRDYETGTIFTYGELTQIEKNDVKKSENAFRKPTENLPIGIQAFENKANFKQSNDSRTFLDSEHADEQQNTYIHLGNVLHAIFSTIRTADDIPQALRQLQSEGILYDEQLTPEKLTQMLTKRLNDPRVAHWFSHRWQLFNECTILYTDPINGSVKDKRPDRVMTDGKETIVVDFKFAKPDEDHHQQVRKYVELLREMGLPNVRGHLWYVYSNKIEDVH